ncbi:ATP-grasp domain-containing protein [Phytohabitans suffuscus]|uniref:ATP-grasp domain-containing protein n=1 Tax=Phytohabitans suffuscus TaxID=624315 RepID=A0A6F8YBJ9_9ACTN|nr:ATP-grasp domain-containing protein [Phytohabitans suffuscus]
MIVVLNEDSVRATRERSRVALVTCDQIPELDRDDQLVLPALRERGVEAVPVAWDAPAVDWSSFALAVIRSPWDYVARRDEFVAWAAKVPRLANPADVVTWNTDKRYLRELAVAGVPVVPTTWVEPGGAWRPPPGGEVVVKPAVGAGSLDSGRYDLDRAEHRELAAAHVARLRLAGRLVMVQPYLAAVDTYGETALLFFPGDGDLAFSHAIRKGAMLTGPDEGVEGLYKEESIRTRSPLDAELEIARKALAAVPGGPDRLLYARVDLIPGPDDLPVLVELELTEPSLFLGTAGGAPERFAEAIAARL